jgi:hypothetical protein
LVVRSSNWWRDIETKSNLLTELWILLMIKRRNCEKENLLPLWTFFGLLDLHFLLSRFLLKEIIIITTKTKGNSRLSMSRETMPIQRWKMKSVPNRTKSNQCLVCAK